MTDLTKERGTFDNVAFDDTSGVCVSVTASSGVVLDEIPRKPTGESKNKKNQIDNRFGYGPFKPSCLQAFNKIWLLTIFLMVFCFLEGFAINGVANAGIPGIERQFQLTSSKSSLIPASQDIGALIVILFVSFIGSRYNKIRWIALGSVIMGLGSFIFMIPHMAEVYEFGSTGSSGPTDNCQGAGPQGGPPPCESEGEKWVGVFMLAQIVHGIGFTPMFTLGTTYLDDNSSPGSAAIYVGICYAATSVGVACGFFAGGQFMEKWFVDFDRVDVDTLGFDATDTRWVGAWWLGFVFTTIAFIVVAIPLFGYPKYMPTNTKATETEAKLQVDNSSCCDMVLNVAKDFIAACVRLAKNPTFIFTSLGGCAASLIIFGVSAFAFKFLAEMYNMGFDTAGVLLGVLILVGSIGMFLGGILIRVFKLELLGILRLNVAAVSVACVLGVGYLASCPEIRLAGLQVPYPNQSAIVGYDAPCNAGCDCDKMGFSPVCGDDDLVYYSACHAGCSGLPPAPFEPYTNCTCVAASLNNSVGLDAKATGGRCEDGCTNLSILVPCLFVMMIAVLTVTTPTSMATMRCVEEDLRPFALGVGWVLFRLLGSIPGPVLIGSVIDNTCKLWTGGMCDSAGMCLLYSKEKLSISIMLWWVILTAVAAVLFFIASIFAGRLVVKEGAYNMEEPKNKTSSSIPS